MAGKNLDAPVEKLLVKEVKDQRLDLEMVEEEYLHNMEQELDWKVGPDHTVINDIPGSVAPTLPLGMAPPESPIEGCPPGLEHLITADQYYVQHCKKVHAIKALQGYESQDRFQILNKFGRRIFYAVGESNCWKWNLSGARPFVVKILDHEGNLVLSLKKPWTLALFWWGGECNGNVVEVRNKYGKLLGRVRQRCRLISPHYDIEGRDGKEFMYMKGPFIACCPFCCLRCYGKFKLFYPPEPHSKKPRKAGRFLEYNFGIGEENTNNALNISFPFELDVEQKATLLGVLFLVHFMYFETSDLVTATTASRAALLSQFDPNRLALMNVRAFDVPGKWYPCKILFISGIILFITFLILFFTDELPFYAHGRFQS